MTAAQLERSVNRAMAWIVRHLDEFDPFARGQEYDIKNGQRVGELGILLHAAVSMSRRAHARAIRLIKAQLERLQEKPEYRDRLVRSPQEFILFAEVFASLKSAGSRSAWQRRLIRHVLDAGYLGLTERLPHRLMDVVSCLDRGGFRHSLPSMRRLYRTSILAGVPCPILLTEDSLYFLTHVLMFATDFGTSAALRWPRRYSEELKQALGSLLICMCQDRHWDLLAELLLCWDCAGFEHDDVYRRGWAALLSVQARDGAVPGPEWALKMHETLAAQSGVSGDASFYFSHHYHTTLVTVIAGSLRLRRMRENRRRSRAAEATPARSGSGALEPRSLLRPRYSPGDNAAACGRAFRWFAHLAAGSGPAAAPRAETLCQILLGCWISSSVSGGERRFDPIASTIGALLLRAEADGALDWSATPASVRIVSAALLNSRGIRLPGECRDDGFVATAAAILRRTPARSALQDLALSEKRVLLHCLGLLPRPRALSRNLLAEAFRSFSPASPPETVQTIALPALSHSMYGTRRLDDRAAYRDMRDLLCGLATSHFRRYDLSGGCGLLRAASYLGPERSASLTGLDYLMLNQRPDGAFGFFGAEALKLAGTSPDANPDIALNLPVSVECVWTLAEACGGWRLYASLPRWQ